jgi:hypothetical protein
VAGHSRCDACPPAAGGPVILAHQGGWDEALFVVGPLLFIVFLLRLAKHRADRANRNRDTPSP